MNYVQLMQQLQALEQALQSEDFATAQSLVLQARASVIEMQRDTPEHHRRSSRMDPYPAITN